MRHAIERSANKRAVRIEAVRDYHPTHIGVNAPGVRTM
jgi:hypothetical protein